jgi:tetratricopeptide (TPR) repeat protein
MGGGLEEEWINQKIGHLEQAVAYDPEFAEAWANLAIDCIFTWNDNNRKDSSYYMRAHEALQQAKRTGPDLPYYHYALSSFAIREHRDPEAAINHLLRALAIDPTFHFAHWRLGAHYYTLGRLAEAQHHFETVLRSEPLLYFPNVNLVQVYMRRGLWNEAIALIQKNKDRANADSRWEFLIPRARYLQSGNKELIRNTIDIGARERNSANLLTAGALLDRDYPLALDHLRERDPEERISIYPRLGFGITHSQLLEALIRFAQDGEWSGEVAEAKAFFRESIDENPMTSPTNWSHLVICAALEKDRDSMASNMTKAREIASSPYYKYRYLAIVEMHIAIAYIVLGENDKAIEILEAASKMDGPIFLNRELDLWFIFDRLRGNPRFDALLKD